MNITINTTHFNITGNQKNDTASKKKPTFRDIREEQMKEKKEKQKAKALKVPKYLLGPDCETMICGSCKVVVEEFSKAIHRSIDNPQYATIADVLAELCASPHIAQKYHDLVGKVCSKKFNNVSIIERITTQQPYLLYTTTPILYYCGIIKLSPMWSMYCFS